jgi:hypothetical protein
VVFLVRARTPTVKSEDDAMTVDGGVEQPGATPPLPTSIWVVAWASLAGQAVLLAGLATFHRTDWYRWQRTKPSAHDGTPIGQLVAIGVLVGVLGGLVGPVEDGLDVRISVAGR